MSTDRTAAFLALIERTRRTRTEEVAARAAKESREISSRAHAEARERVARAVRENRERSRRDIAAARAELETAFRKLSQATHRAMLVEGMQDLVRALEARWREPKARRQWIDALLARAAEDLPRSRWRIEHPPGLALEGLLDAIGRASGAPPELSPEVSIRTGLRISASSALLDGTIDGLLARRTEVEGRLLHELDQEIDRG